MRQPEQPDYLFWLIGLAVATLVFIFLIPLLANFLMWIIRVC